MEKVAFQRMKMIQSDCRNDLGSYASIKELNGDY